ncbi:MAG: hydroxyacylglutathione hydrolase [Rhizobiales bacterium]|nr:hydroxyacylglutathione hydrolase [Hyphomicrobiales bacterium]NRB14703.1 hydroxyacylglutathione hydrolase [Hyphomicrobiales bacterium]
MQIIQIPCLQDNYAVLIHNDATGETILFDAPEHDAIAKVLTANGWNLTAILLTHYHLDHIQGVSSLMAQFGGTIYGSAINSAGLGFALQTIDETGQLTVAGLDIQIFDTPGHKSDHICFYVAQLKMAVVADVIFSLGCGRLLDGSAAQLFNSIQKLQNLPDDTMLYCGHEYTASNGQFARAVEPNNVALRARLAEVKTLRNQGKPTLPTSLAAEQASNPFLRTNSAEIRQNLNMPHATELEVFTKLRQMKDNF